MYCMRHNQNPFIFRTLSIIVYSDIITHMHVLFRYIQPHYGIFKTMFNSNIFRTLAYSESWQNPRYVQNLVKAYTGLFKTLCSAFILRTLPFWKLSHIKNFGIFNDYRHIHIQNPIYLCIFRYYSIMIIVIT